jgi:hypothetical protein
MLNKSLVLALAVVLGALLTASEAQAWGAVHTGFTHVGPGGIQHYGSTTVAGPYGAYSGAHYGAVGYGGAYHAGYGYMGGGGVGYAGYGGAYHYSASSYGGYGVGGFHTGAVYGPGYSAGVYRIGY